MVMCRVHDAEIPARFPGTEDINLVHNELLGASQGAYLRCQKLQIAVGALQGARNVHAPTTCRSRCFEPRPCTRELALPITEDGSGLKEAEIILKFWALRAHEADGRNEHMELERTRPRPWPTDAVLARRLHHLGYD